MAIAKNLLFVIIFVVNTRSFMGLNFTLDELKKINGSCHHKSTCEEPFRGCYCDDICIEYGDCCLQAKRYNRTKMAEAFGKYECVRGSSTDSYYMKAKCRDDWTDEIVKKQCTNNFSNSRSYETFHTDPFLDSPVTSILTKITYKNHYCAVCNNETLANLEPWKTELNCLDANMNISKSYFKEHVQFVNGTWTLSVNNTDRVVFQSCDISPVVSETALHDIRTCVKQIGTCSNQWTDRSSEKVCRSYITLVYNKAGIGLPYRNYHCAKCNFADLQSLDCYNTNLRRPDLSEDPVSLSVLFDFGAQKSYCSRGHIWDPFSKRCRSVICNKKKYEYRHGKCVKARNLRYVNDTDGSSVGASDYDTGDYDTCDKMFLNETDFVKLPNLSIFVSSTSRTYALGEYELLDDGILVCISVIYSPLMGYLTLCGLTLSSICLLLHLIVFLVVPDLQNLSGKNFASLCVALLAAYVCFIATKFHSHNSEGCQHLASAMYYFFIASFAWMNVMSFDIWRTLQITTTMFRVSSRYQWKKFIGYSLYAWCLPGALLAVVLGIDWIQPDNLPKCLLPDLGEKLCWFGHRKAILVYFAAPLAVIMTMNIVFFAIAIRIVVGTSNSVNALSATHPNRIQLTLYLRLAVLMGLSWISGIVAGFFQNEYVWYIFIILNAFQGLYILIAYTCTKKIRRSLKKHNFKGRSQVSISSMSHLDKHDTHAHISNKLAPDTSNVITV